MKMIPMLAVATLGAVVFATPAVAQDDSTTTTVPTAQEQCRTERTEMGKATFAAAYGTNKKQRNAFGKCVSQRRAATKEARAEARSNAAKECRAERTADAEAFRTTYGTGKNGKNAFGKCVSGKAKAKTAETVEEQVAADINAAKACKAERKADAAAFRQKYGTNKNKRNAFGKCVAAQSEAEQAPAA